MLLLAPLLAQALALPPSQPSQPEAGDLARYGFVAAVSTQALAFAGGVALIGLDNSGGSRARTGWLTLGVGFLAGPILAHGAAQSWLRTALYSIVPTICLVGTATVLGQHDGSIDQLPLAKQRPLWAFTSAGLLGSAIALVDAAVRLPSADSTRITAVRLAPSASSQSFGLVAWGAF
jgi:hypothetical protein